jgi:hypothetical protein
MQRTLEQLVAWWNRIQYHTPPWDWKSDPYLQGITEAEFKWLRSLDEPPENVEITGV